MNAVMRYVTLGTSEGPGESLIVAVQVRAGRDAWWCECPARTRWAMEGLFPDADLRETLSGIPDMLRRADLGGNGVMAGPHAINVGQPMPSTFTPEQALARIGDRLSFQGEAAVITRLTTDPSKAGSEHKLKEQCTS